MVAQVVKEDVEGAPVGRLFLPSLALLFFLSGLCGLIYQVLWLRQLALIFGVTIYAASTVLASFMAGLAVGSFVAGRLVDRARNPLLWYGVAEVLIGLSALVTPVALDAMGRLYAGLYPSLNSLGVLAAIRFLLSFAVLIVPTTLMGATLPIVIKSSLLRAEGLGGRVSFLYATNTAGAIVGALVAGFYLIGGIGIAQSFKLAAAINVLVGIVAIAMSMKLKPSLGDLNAEREVGVTQNPTDQDSGRVISPRTRRLVLFVFALSGLISLALEVVWFRILILFLEATTYAFTIMLATVLCGIAVGSYLVTPLMKRRLDWLKLLALTELALAVTVAFSLASLGFAHGGVDPSAGELSAQLSGAGLWRSLSASFISMFPSSLLMGIAFPIGMQLVASDGESDSARSGKKIGLFYALNVFGAILGPAVAGFLLLPWLGSRGSLRLLAALSLISGLSLLLALPRSQRFFAIRAAAVSSVLFLAVVVTMPDPFAMVLGYRHPGDQLLWREEGVQTTASVHREASGRRMLYLNGLHQANDSRTMVRSHRLLGYLAMILHPNPKDALVIGLGGGVTVGAASEQPGVNVEVVELSKTVLHAADWFSDVNNNALRQPNVHTQIDDGRNYMMLTSKRYDVITADLTRPDHAGAGNLYSAEYFRHARNALKEDGLMIQWNTVQSEKHYKLIMRTFLSVFPYTTLWAKGKIMVGSKQPLELDPSNFDRRLQDPAFKRALESIGLDSFQSLLSRYSAGPEELSEFVGPGSILTDDQPSAEYFLSLSGSDRKVKHKKWRGGVAPLIKR